MAKARGKPRAIAKGRFTPRDIDTMAAETAKHMKLASRYAEVELPRVTKYERPATFDKKKNSPSPTAGAAPPTLDLSRFTTPQRGSRSSIRWFDQLTPAVQDYLLEVAELFQSGRSTWTVSAAFDQLREELGLSTSKATFTSFLRGAGAYRNFKK